MGGGWEEVDERWMGGGWDEVDAGGWEVDGRRWMGGGWEVDGRWMGDGCGECGECMVHHEQTSQDIVVYMEVDGRWIRRVGRVCMGTLLANSHDTAVRRANLQKQKPSVTRDSRAIPQPSTNLAQPCWSSMF